MTFRARINALLVFILPFVFATLAWKVIGLLGMIVLLLTMLSANVGYRYPMILLPLVGGIALFFAAPVLTLPVILGGYGWTGIYWLLCYGIVN